MKKIIIRTLGGSGIGYGHFYRCLSLAKAINNIDHNIKIFFLINKDLAKLVEKSGFKYIISNNLYLDIVVLDRFQCDLYIFDSYLGNDQYLMNIKEKSRLMLIDDNNNIYDSGIPDIIYNGNINAEKLNYMHVDKQLKLLGLKYLIMKEEYWGNNEVDLGNKDGILITTGGTDDYEISLMIMNAIRNTKSKIRVIIGPAYKDGYIKRIEEISDKDIELIYKPDSLKTYIASSKIAITSAGSTVYEVLSQKTIPVIYSMADNQDLICRELITMGVSYLGKYPEIRFNDIDILNMIKEKTYNENFNLDLWNKIDGLGATRVAIELLGIVL